MKQVILLLIILVPNLIYANFGGYYIQDSNGAGNFFQKVSNNTISLEKEVLNITLNQRILFNGKFSLKNNSSDSQEIYLVFPQLSFVKIVNENGQIYTGDITPLNEKLFINGLLVKFDETKYSKIVTDFENLKLFSKHQLNSQIVDFLNSSQGELAQEMPIYIYKVIKLVFKPMESNQVDIVFNRPWFYKDAHFTNSISTDGIKSFDYIFETARTWKDKTIRDFQCTITFPIDASLNIDFNRNDFELIDGNKLQIKKKDWIPSSTENLRIEWYSNYQISPLSGWSETFFAQDFLYDKFYSWHHATDGSKMTAWCFKERIVLEKEKIEYFGDSIYKNLVKIEKITSVKDTLSSFIVNKIKITNGFAKNKKTYYQNSRPKIIELIFEESHPNSKTIEGLITRTVQKIVLEDTMEEQEFDLERSVDILGYKRGVKSDFVDLKLRIVDFYRGDKYDDICISEIKFE